MGDRIVLIDGHSILNRAFYGLPDLTNSKQVHTNAVYGFLNILFKILEEEKPEYLTVAFDVKAPTFRHEMFKEYKGTRKPMPEELREQVPLMKEVLKAMGIYVVEKPGLEADDILGTIAKRCEQNGMEVSLVSGDRDLLQIASDHIKIRIPKTKMGKTEIEDYYTKDVYEKYQVSPHGIIELKALMGDTADNIPGVPKVGEKTATELIVKYETIDGVYEHIDEITKKSIKESLVENKELAYLSRTLATIETNGEFDYELSNAKIGSFYTKEAYVLFKELEFKHLLSRFEADSKETVEKPVVEYIKSQPELDKHFDKMRKCKMVGVQLFCEKASDNKGISTEKEGQLTFSFEEPKDFFALSVCYSDNEKHLIYLTGNDGFVWEEIENRIHTLLDNNVVVSTFDVKKIYPLLNREHKNLFCTNIAAYLLNPLKSDYEVGEVGQEYCNVLCESYQELFGKLDFSEAAATKEEQFATYAANCALVNHDAYEKLHVTLSEKGMLELFHEIEMPLSFVLYAMEQEGVIAKAEELKKYSEQLESQIVILEKRIYEQAGEEFNINSPKQLGEILFGKLGIKGGKKTKTGYSTSADVLEKLSPEYPVIKDILEYRGLTKLKSTYADGLVNYIGEDGRIHTHYNQTITATGRISSTEPNLQNIPMRTELGRQIRKVFVPKEGCVFVDADYSQIELRLLAHMSQDEELIQAYKTDTDIHRITASQVFHIPLNEVTDLQRRNAKAVNFGIVYGISSFGLSQDLSISRKEAGEYIDRYFATYPKVKEYLDSMVETAKKEGSVKTLYGRIRPIPELSSSNFMQRSFGERIAMNSPIQGTAADIMKIAMVRLFYSMREKGLKSKLILQVHDEVLVEAFHDEVEIVKELILLAMEGAANLSVKLEIDMHTGADWYDAK